MPVQTQVIWGPNLDPSSGIEIANKGYELSDLQTAPFEKIPGPGPDQTTFDRFWIDQTSAENWIAFIQPYNPVSATIIE